MSKPTMRFYGDMPKELVDNALENCKKTGRSIICIACPDNKNGHCEVIKKDVPKLKSSAVEWPKDML